MFDPHTGCSFSLVQRRTYPLYLTIILRKYGCHGPLDFEHNAATADVYGKIGGIQPDNDVSQFQT